MLCYVPGYHGNDPAGGHFLNHMAATNNEAGGEKKISFKLLFVNNSIKK